ncbi:hypothetical protein VTJ04DRAFT_1114 [Mycothermus thermophilus]|uniref:uncharacterized protein n=1 Tax=Humicola insolens TaxID=85995 RepID=UPI003744543E
MPLRCRWLVAGWEVVVGDGSRQKFVVFGRISVGSWEIRLGKKNRVAVSAPSRGVVMSMASSDYSLGRRTRARFQMRLVSRVSCVVITVVLLLSTGIKYYPVSAARAVVETRVCEPLSRRR